MIMKNIVLIGHKSCGKTTIGRYLADYLQYDFLDSDELMLSKMESQFQSIADVYCELGEDQFRALEKRCIFSISTHKTIIATGGGVIVTPEVMHYLKTIAFVVYLKVDYNVLKKRNALRANHGILSSSIQTSSEEKNYKNRDWLYRYFSDFNIQIDNQELEDIILSIVEISHGQ